MVNKQQVSVSCDSHLTVYELIIDSSHLRLTALPNRIGLLKNLKELHVRKNCLKYFPISIKDLSLYTFSGSHISSFLSVYFNHISSSSAQQNPTLKEKQLNHLSYSPSHDFPPLLEITAREVLKKGIAWRKGAIPLSLEGNLKVLCKFS